MKGATDYRRLFLGKSWAMVLRSLRLSVIDYGRSVYNVRV